MGGVGLQTKVLLSFATDVTGSFVVSGSGDFTAAGLELFAGGKQNGSGDSSPTGRTDNGMLSLSVGALPQAS